MANVIHQKLFQIGKNGSLLMKVWVKPGAKSCQIVAVDDEGVHIRVAAPPKEGEANQRLVEYLAEVIGVRPRKLSIIQGLKSREKLISLDGVDPAQVELNIMKSIETDD